MGIEKPVGQIISQLQEWQALPKYSVERRLDVWLVPFLAPFLGSRMDGELKLVTAEFPLPLEEDGSARSINADFLLYRNGGKSLDGKHQGDAWILVELKTDASSIRAEQFERYFSSSGAPRTMQEIVAGLERIVPKTKAFHRKGYRRIIQLFKKPNPAGKIEAPIEVCCISPVDPKAPGVEYMGLRELADWTPHSSDAQALWELLKPLLRAIASSAKARRLRRKQTKAQRPEGIVPQ